jgi:hypothetical protein
LTPPDLRRPGGGDVLSALRLGAGGRRLGRTEIQQLNRTLPMSVGDLVEDTFELEPLRAVIAARGIQYVAMRPRSAVRRASAPTWSRAFSADRRLPIP